MSSTGSNNVALGSGAGRDLLDGSNNIVIGVDVSFGGDSNTIRIGRGDVQTRAFVAGISGVPVTGVGVVVASDGQLGVAPSSERFKDKIEPMDKASEAILALHPVMFRYKKDLDPKGMPQFGLIAEEVAEVNPDLVVRDAEGKVYTVRYDAVNAMLLNEFLKEHRRVEELASTVAKQEATIARQQTNFQSAIARQQKEMEIVITQLKEQAAQIQKVNAQLNARGPAPKAIVSNP
jgi:hypothetical protein